MNEIEVSVQCYSEKENAGVGFGISLDLDAESFQSIGTDWICEGMADCFYENYFEFEPGINKAKLLTENNSTLTFRQALYNVFGDFWVSYYIDDDRAEL